MIKKALLISCAIFSLSACSTVEFAHVPLDCVGELSHNVRFTDWEVEYMEGCGEYEGVNSCSEINKKLGNSIVRKFDLIKQSLKIRIEAQCEMIEVHNRLHKG